MMEHLSKQEIENYLKRNVSPGDLLKADDHLAECDACFGKIADAKAAQSTVSSFQNYFLRDAELRDHLTYQQIASYVDNEADNVDREIVEVHRNTCRECAGQIDDLRQMRALIAADTKETRAPVLGKFSFSDWWNRLWANSALKIAVPAMALILFAAMIGFILISRQSPNNEIAEVAEPATNQQQSAPVSETNQSNEETQPNGTASENTNSAIPNNTNSNTPEPKILISLNDAGSRIELDENGNLKGLQAPQYEKKIKAALETQNIEIAAAPKELNTGRGVLMGSAEDGVPFALSNPVGKLIQSDRPTFRWQPLKDAESYVVEVFDVNFNKVASSQPTQKTEWTVNAPLKRGTIYQWQVTAIKDAQEIKSPVRPAPDAKFKVLDAAKASEIGQAKRKYKNSHLLLGILYANAGLLQEAENEFQALLKQNPKSEAARKLLQKVRQKR